MFTFHLFDFIVSFPFAALLKLMNRLIFNFRFNLLRRITKMKDGDSSSKNAISANFNDQICAEIRALSLASPSTSA
jgi:hypothetical protein